MALIVSTTFDFVTMLPSKSGKRGQPAQKEDGKEDAGDRNTKDAEVRTRGEPEAWRPPAENLKQAAGAYLDKTICVEFSLEAHEAAALSGNDAAAASQDFAEAASELVKQRNERLGDPLAGARDPKGRVVSPTHW